MGSPIYMQTLTTSMSDMNTDATYSYQWYVNDSESTAGGTAISGATESTYTVGSGYVGKYIYVVVTVNDSKQGVKTYIDITSQVQSAPSNVTLTPISKTYDGDNFENDEGTTNSNQPIMYTYYTDSNCSSPTTTDDGAVSNGSAPMNAGNYYVKASVAAGDYSASSVCVEHTIEPKNASVTWQNIDTFTYNSLEQIPTASVATGVSGETMELMVTTTMRTTAINVGSYIATASCVESESVNCSNYNLTNNTKSFRIIQNSSATISYGTTSVTKTYGDGTFTNPLTNTGDGTVTYASSNTSVATVNSTSGLITIKQAGSTTITATVTDGTNYSYNTKTTSYILTVGQDTNSVSLTCATLTYTGSAQTLISSSSSTAGVIYFNVGSSLSSSNYSSSGSTTKPTGTNAGSYTIYYYVPASTNYKEISGSKTCTIAKKTAEISYGTTSVTKTYGDGTFTNPLTNTGDGTVTYASSNTSVATVNSTSGLITIKQAGSTTITATVTDGTNYSYPTKTASYNLTVGKQPVNAPTNVAVSTAGIVTWTASSNATGYQISINNSTWTTATSGVDYLSTITASTGSRTVYVRAVNSNTTNYSTSSNATKAVTVYKVSFVVNSATQGSVDTSSYNVISGATVSTSSNKLTINGITSGTTTKALKTVTATAKAGYHFSSWSKTSGSITAATTITATCAGNTYTVKMCKNPDYINKAGLIATLGGRKFYKSSDGAALVGYVYDGTYTGPILIGATADSVKYGTSQDSTIHTTQGQFSSGYFSSTDYWMSGNLTSTGGLATYKGSVPSGSTANEKVSLSGLYNRAKETCTSQEFVYGTAQNLTANSHTRTGYTFGGWATSPTGGVTYANQASVNNLTTTAGDTVYLYAVWTPTTTPPTTPGIKTIYNLWDSRSYSTSGLSSSSGTWTTTNGDPMFRFDNIGNINGANGAYVKLKEALSSPITIQIYYAASNGAYSGSQVVSGQLPAGQTDFYIAISDTSVSWKSFRFDVGTATGIKYKIDRMGVSASSGQWNNDRVGLRLTTTDNGLGISKWQETYSSSASSSGTDTSTSWVDYANSASSTFFPPMHGTNKNTTQYLRACDNVWNCGGKGSVTVKIDWDAPKATLSATASGTTVTAKLSNVTDIINGVGGSGVSSTYYYAIVANGASCTGYTTGSNKTYTWTKSAGTYKVCAKIHDKAGSYNWSEYSTTVTVS